jgi:prepilin-type N-terminal cleavage/methylation domain-containing protein
MRKHEQGFTLAELLIALAIIGVIATFTIPKVLQSTGSNKNAAVAKEIASTLAEAWTTVRLNSGIAAATKAEAITTGLNYVKIETSGTPGTISGESQLATCAAATPCIYLHNGGIIQYHTNSSFAGTAATNAVYYNIDPDGDGTTAGSATIVIYANGRMTTNPHKDAATATGTSAVTVVATDPSWIANWN